MMYNFDKQMFTPLTQDTIVIDHAFFMTKAEGIKTSQIANKKTQKSLPHH